MCGRKATGVSLSIAQIIQILFTQVLRTSARIAQSFARVADASAALHMAGTEKVPKLGLGSGLLLIAPVSRTHSLGLGWAWEVLGVWTPSHRSHRSLFLLLCTGFAHIFLNEDEHPMASKRLKAVATRDFSNGFHDCSRDSSKHL